MQVLKKSARDVVRVRDVSSLIDVSDMQQHVCNGSMVVHLKERYGNKGFEFRPSHRHLKTIACTAYKQRIKRLYRFCSIGCKDVGHFFSLSTK